ncbi:seminal plasma protein HSP-1-like [Arapaima gigas]
MFFRDVSLVSRHPGGTLTFVIPTSESKMLQVAVIFLLLPAVSGQLAGSWQTKVKEMDISADYCVFPFQYKGLLYHSCTGVNSANGRLWCSLTSNYDQDRLWGYCLGKESFGETEPSCVFPFIYGQKVGLLFLLRGESEQHTSILSSSRCAAGQRPPVQLADGWMGASISDPPRS